MARCPNCGHEYHVENLFGCPLVVDPAIPPNIAILTNSPRPTAGSAIHEMLFQSGIPEEFWHDEIRRMVQDGRIIVGKFDPPDKSG